MNRNILILIWFIILIIVLATTSCTTLNTEHFLYNRSNILLSRYCGDCGKNSIGECNNCSDCGTCIDYYGNAECVPGDARAPYFREDCVEWKYNVPIQIYPYPSVFPVYYPPGYRSRYYDNIYGGYGFGFGEFDGFGGYGGTFSSDNGRGSNSGNNHHRGGGGGGGGGGNHNRNKK